MVFLLSSLNIAAQEPVPAPTPAEKTALTRSDSRSEWTLEISSSGGLDGRGTGGLSVTSAGTLTCSLPRRCTGPMDAPALQSIHGFVTAVNLPLAVRIPGNNPSVSIPVAAGVCMDCVVTTMLLRIRDSKGLEWSYSLTWDPTTLSNIPPDFKQIFQSAAALAK
jgi:hypothetical protein